MVRRIRKLHRSRTKCFMAMIKKNPFERGRYKSGQERERKVQSRKTKKWTRD